MLKVDVRKPIASVILDRPDVHNAFNDELVKRVTDTFTELELGIIPAIIAPFVIARLGPGRAREFFITGERFLAPVAMNIGLIQHVASHEAALDALIDSKVSQILTSAPGAIAAAKELIFGVAARNLESSLEFAAEAIAVARASAEGQAGMRAFLERQKPPWIEKTDKAGKNDGK